MRLSCPKLDFGVLNTSLEVFRPALSAANFPALKEIEIVLAGSKGVGDLTVLEELGKTVTLPATESPDGNELDKGSSGLNFLNFAALIARRIFLGSIVFLG